MNEIKIPESVAVQMQDYVETHIQNCYNSLYDTDELPSDWDSFGPYCGCSTCDTREYLLSAFTFLKENGIVDIYVVNDEEK